MVINLFLSHQLMGAEEHLRVEMSHGVKVLSSTCGRCRACVTPGLGGGWGGLFARFLCVCIHVEAEAERLGNRRLLWTPAM